MQYLSKYQTNDMCNFCQRFNKTCSGKMWDEEDVFVNRYCPEFKDRNYQGEPMQYRLKKYSEIYKYN